MILTARGAVTNTVCAVLLPAFRARDGTRAAYADPATGTEVTVLVTDYFAAVVARDPRPVSHLHVGAALPVGVEDLRDKQKEIVKAIFL